MSNRRTFIRQSAAAASALAFPLVGGAQPKAIKVGILHPVTGALAYSGQQCREGALMAVDDINKTGIKALSGAKLEVMLGDGFDVPADLGSFDRIMVTAAMEQIPEALTARLEPDGLLIAPVGPQNGPQTLISVRRTESGLVRKELLDVRFVPALPGIAREL